MVAVKTKVVSKSVAKVGNLTDDIALSRYEELSSKKKEIESEMEQIRDWALAKIELGKKVDNGDSEFRKVVSQRMSWSVDDLKELFGRLWQAYAKADDKLVRARMETDAEMGSAIRSKAKVEETVSVKVFKK